MLSALASHGTSRLYLPKSLGGLQLRYMYKKKQIRMWDMAKQTNMSAVVGDIDLHIYLSLFLLQA